MADETVKTNEASEAKDPEREIAQLKADETNKTRTGVGTRVMVGRTRGKGSLVVSYENFDDSQPDTLPKSIKQFTEVTGKKDEESLLEYLISGYNLAMYTAASDPLAEHVNPAWPDEAQNQFRIVVRNYAKGTNTPLEKAVSLIKPGFDAQFAKPAA